jgi:hypothetical protein
MRMACANSRTSHVGALSCARAEGDARDRHLSGDLESAQANLMAAFREGLRENGFVLGVLPETNDASNALADALVR